MAAQAIASVPTGLRRRLSPEAIEAIEIICSKAIGLAESQKINLVYISGVTPANAQSLLIGENHLKVIYEPRIRDDVAKGRLYIEWHGETVLHVGLYKGTIDRIEIIDFGRTQWMTMLNAEFDRLHAEPVGVGLRT